MALKERPKTMFNEEELDELLNNSATTEPQSFQQNISPLYRLPKYGQYFIVENFNLPKPKNISEIYCPTCQISYPCELFTIRRKKVFGLKTTTYILCKKCRSLKRKSKWISLDPAFGFKLTLNELALIFHSLAKGETLNEISEVLTENRPSKDSVQKKTIMQAVYRLAPIVTRYITDCCKPKIIDEFLVMDTTYFTHKVPVRDEDNIIYYKLIQRFVTNIIGRDSKAIYGYGIASSKSASAKNCIKMAINYTSGMLIKCHVKYDGDMEIEAALKEAGVPKENLIAIPKTVYKGGINEIEGYFKDVRAKLKKHRFKYDPSIFARLTAFSADWNLFKKHSLFDGKWTGTLAELLQIEQAPSSWQDLIERSWRYILSNKELFEKYYPNINRGAKRLSYGDKSECKYRYAVE
ncbi:MAG: hypothetical protein QW702_07870 [Candidatus Bathyarchaeia archaeon]